MLLLSRHDNSSVVYRFYRLSQTPQDSEEPHSYSIYFVIKFKNDIAFELWMETILIIMIFAVCVTTCKQQRTIGLNGTQTCSMLRELLK